MKKINYKGKKPRQTKGINLFIVDCTMQSTVKLKHKKTKKQKEKIVFSN